MYCGHVQRYPDARWVKFATRAVIPEETKTGRQKQYTKMITKLLKEHGLTVKMMQDADGTGAGWRTKLNEIFHKKPTPANEQTIGHNKEAQTLSLS